MKKLFTLLLFVNISFSQDYGNDIEAMKLCSVLQTNNFNSDMEAEKGLEKILSVIGASKRFVLQSCSNINNAIAATYKGVRYIFYDREFMSRVNDGNDWSSLFILAHEVGHHINGHSLDLLLFVSDAIEPETLENKRKQEIEADEFAAFILAKLGATLDETKYAIESLSNNEDDTYSTHPSKSKRLLAIEDGYKKGSSEKDILISETLQPYETYFYSSLEQFKIGKLSEANNLIEKAKEIFEVKESLTFEEKLVYSQILYNSGNIKTDLEKFYPALYDYNLSVKNFPLSDAYFNRAYVKKQINDIQGAMDDYNTVINIDNTYQLAYVNRARLKSDEYGDEYGAIEDYTKAIELDPKDDVSLNNRGGAKARLGDRYGAISDWTKVVEINPRSETAYFNLGKVKNQLKDYYGAISDFSRAIEIKYNYIDAYKNRGASKGKLNDYKGMCRDFNFAFRLGAQFDEKEKVILNYCKSLR